MGKDLKNNSDGVFSNIRPKIQVLLQKILNCNVRRVSTRGTDLRMSCCMNSGFRFCDSCMTFVLCFRFSYLFQHCTETLAAFFSAGDEDTLKIELKDASLDLSWSIERLKEALSSCNGPFPLKPTSCSPKFISSLAALVDEQSFPEAKIGLASGVIAFLYLYTSILGLVSVLILLLNLFALVL